MLKIVGRFFSKALYITAYVYYGLAAEHSVYVVGTWIFFFFFFFLIRGSIEFYSAVRVGS